MVMIVIISKITKFTFYDITLHMGKMGLTCISAATATNFTIETVTVTARKQKFAGYSQESPGAKRSYATSTRTLQTESNIFPKFSVLSLTMLLM